MTKTLTLLDDAQLTHVAGGGEQPFGPIGTDEHEKFGPCPNPDAFPKPAPNPDPFPVMPGPFVGP